MGASAGPADCDGETSTVADLHSPEFPGNDEQDPEEEKPDTDVAPENLNSGCNQTDASIADKHTPLNVKTEDMEQLENKLRDLVSTRTEFQEEAKDTVEMELFNRSLPEPIFQDFEPVSMGFKGIKLWHATITF